MQFLCIHLELLLLVGLILELQKTQEAEVYLTKSPVGAGVKKVLQAKFQLRIAFANFQRGGETGVSLSLYVLEGSICVSRRVAKAIFISGLAVI